MSKLATVPLSLVRENPVALRSVDKSTEAYQGLVNSVKNGWLGAITVREKKEDVTGLVYYEVLDGLHRTNAARDAGLTEIGVDIVDKTDEEVLEAQMTLNLHRIETKPVEYARQLKRILSNNPTMTEGELAIKIAKSPGWLRDRLSIQKIQDANILSMIDDGKIALLNAYTLAKLPVEEHAAFLTRAMTEPAAVFAPVVNERLKELRESAKKGGVATPTEFVPVAHLRKISEIKEVSADGAIAAKIVASNNASTAIDGFQAGLKWALHLDTEGTAAQVAKDSARKADESAAKERRLKEREAKRATEAAIAASASA